MRHEDLSLLSEPWCKELLTHPDVEIIINPDRRPDPPLYEHCSNSLFAETLWTDHTITVWCPFRINPKNNQPPLHCAMLGVGSGLDGATGRLHGGLISMVLDQVMGDAAMEALGGTFPPATKSLTVEYRRPVATPCLLLIRSKAERIEGRNAWVGSSLEDGKGVVFATARSCFVRPREKKDAML